MKKLMQRCFENDFEALVAAEAGMGINAELVCINALSLSNPDMVVIGFTGAWKTMPTSSALTERFQRNFIPTKRATKPHPPACMG